MSTLGRAISKQARCDPACLACDHVLVKDETLSCDLWPDGIPQAFLDSQMGCEDLVASRGDGDYED